MLVQMQVSVGSGLSSHQLTPPAEQHVHMEQNFPFLPLKMREKKNQREKNEIISAISDAVQRPSHKQRASGKFISLSRLGPESRMLGGRDGVLLCPTVPWLKGTDG